MADYSVEIRFDNNSVRQVNGGGKKLCCAFGVASQEGGGPEFDVIAWSSTIASSTSIGWSEKYKIAASSDRFMGGVRFNLGTDMTDISPGQSCTLPGDWSLKVNNDAGAPPGGFKFNNQAGRGTAVLCKEVNGRQTPIYLSRGSDKLIPKLSIRLWFDRNGDPGNMVDRFDNSIDVEMSSSSSRKAVLSYEGSWKILENS